MQATQLASANRCPLVSPQPRHAQRHRQPHTPAENTPAQTHTLLMTRHPNHPNRPTNDRRTPNQHTTGTRQHVRSDAITEATQRTKQRTSETHSCVTRDCARRDCCGTGRRQIQATTLPSKAQMTVRIQAADSSSCRRQPISTSHCPPVSPQPRHAQRHRQPHTSGEQPGTNSHAAHDATPKPPQQTNQ